MQFERRRRAMPTLNMTSLVDVILMLVIFFMLTTSFTRIQYMDLSLPGDAAKPAKLTKAGTTILDLTNYGELRLDGKTVLLTDLEERLRNLFKKSPNQKVLVKSGDEVSVQRLVTVLDTIYVSGGRALAVDHLIEAREVDPITMSPDGEEYSPQDVIEKGLE